MLAKLNKEQIQVRRDDWWDLLLASIFNMTIFGGNDLGRAFFRWGRTVVIVYTMPLWAMLLLGFYKKKPQVTTAIL